MTETLNQVQAELVKSLLNRERQLDIFLKAIEYALSSCPVDDIEGMSALRIDADATAIRIRDIDEVLRLLEAR